MHEKSADDINLDRADRAMQFYEVTAADSKSAEDSLLDARSAPSLRDDTRRERRWLVISSVTAILIAVFDLRPERIAALDLELAGQREGVVFWGAFLVTVYFLFEFLVFARRDYENWRDRVRVAYRRLGSSLEAQRIQASLAFGRSSMTDHEVNEVDKLISVYLSNPVVSGRRWIFGLMESLPGWAEVLVPTLLGIAALVALAVKLCA